MREQSGSATDFSVRFMVLVWSGKKVRRTLDFKMTGPGKGFHYAGLVFCS